MELITERLVLREFEESDWTAVLAYQRDPLYLRYYEWTERTPTAVPPPPVLNPQSQPLPVWSGQRRGRGPRPCPHAPPPTSTPALPPPPNSPISAYH